MNVTDLRKAFSARGIKGFSSANRATFTAAIEAAEVEAYAEDAARTPVAPKPAKKGTCEDCGRKVGKSGHPTLCKSCYDYAGWENNHSDEGHANGEGESQDDCPVCHPELDPRTARKSGRSRLGMVIIAKGDETHKSNTFKVAAEAAGWTVNIQVEEYEEGNTRHYATATKGEDSISLAWEGRAYDYPASSAKLNGRDRKVRNLKEALRVI